MNTRSEPKVRLDNLFKKFDKVVAVDQVNLEIQQGEFVTLLGPSGSGKTTILKIMAGFEKQTGGEVFIDGEPVTDKPPHRRNVGMVFQNYALFPHLTVAENISFPLRMRKFSKLIIRKETRKVLELVKMSEYENRYPKQLSGGQQQRIALVRSLVFNPSLILMDEPLGALDKKLREHMQIELKRIQKELDMTVIYVTHDQSEALNMSDRIAVLNEGRLQQVGSPRDLYENPSNLFVADFIGESNFIRGTLTSLHGGIASVRTTWGVDVKARCGSNETIGRDVVVTLHPEKIRLMPHADESLNSVRGRVTEVVYLGEITKYYILFENGQTILAKHHNRSGETSYGPGATVFVAWVVEDCRLVD